MAWVYDDGGRFAAGYRGRTKDCAVRAIAIATQRPYREVAEGLSALGARERRKGGKKGSPSNGFRYRTIRKYLDAMGWVWHPAMGIGTGCTVHLRASELPSGRIIINVSKHITCMVDGLVHDTHNPRRGGTRCVYGYWTAPGGGAK